MDTPQLEALCRDAAQHAVSWRHRIHEHPELSFQEFETTRFLETHLRAMGPYEIIKVAPTGLMAVLKTGRPGKTLAFRADIDALPIQEDARNCPCSQVPGVMHACGHDGHAAALLGAAQVLAQCRDSLSGEIRLIFQPAEEQQPGGAQAFVDAGLLDHVDCVYGMHFQSQEEVGSIWLKPGAMLAATYTFDLVVTGKGTHAAFPHLGSDAILAAAQLTCALQQVVSRRINPICRALLSVTSIQGGNSYNSLPAEVTLKGTIRILDSACERTLLEALAETVHGIEALCQVSCALKLQKGYAAVENDAGCVERASAIFSRHFGPDAIHTPLPVMGGEDFSAYLSAAPGCYYRIGARKCKPDGSYYPSHQSRHEINDDALYPAILATVFLALET